MKYKCQVTEKSPNKVNKLQLPKENQYITEHFASFKYLRHRKNALNITRIWGEMQKIKLHLLDDYLLVLRTANSYVKLYSTKILKLIHQSANTTHLQDSKLLTCFFILFIIYKCKELTVSLPEENYFGYLEIYYQKFS